MGGHGHHEPPYKVPDYKIYKIEDCPRLVKLQKKLAAKGLTDPWLRNEVWRYREAPPTLTIARTFLFRGFGVGFGLFGLTVLYEQLTKSPDDGHGHH